MAKADHTEQSPSDLSPERKALAALAAALAKALDSRHPGVGQDFLGYLDQIHVAARDWDVSSQEVIETLQWTQTLYRTLK